MTEVGGMRALRKAASFKTPSLIATLSLRRLFRAGRAIRGIPDHCRRPARPGNLVEMDCLISAAPGHRVADLSAALRALPEGRRLVFGRPGFREPRRGWPCSSLAGRHPAASGPAAGGQWHPAGARLGLGGPPPEAGRTGESRRTSRPGATAAWEGAELRVVSGPDAGLAVPLPPGEHLLGREGTVPLANTDVSRRHCVLTVAPDGASFALRDLGSQNGTGLDGSAIGTEPVPVRPGQLIHAGRDVLTITAGAGSPTRCADPGDPFGLLVNRQMRTAPALPEPVVIDLGRSGGQARSGSQWLTMALGPAVSVVIGVALGAVTHQWLFLLVGLGGTVASLVPQAVNRRTAAGHARAGKRQLAEAAAAARTRLADMTEAEQHARRAALPDPATLARIATGPDARLWERTPDDEDFLRLRVGTGDLPARTVTVRDGQEPGGPRGAHDGPAQPCSATCPSPPTSPPSACSASPRAAHQPVHARLGGRAARRGARAGRPAPGRAHRDTTELAVGSLAAAHAPARRSRGLAERRHRPGYPGEADGRDPRAHRQQERGRRTTRCRLPRKELRRRQPPRPAAAGGGDHRRLRRRTRPPRHRPGAARRPGGPRVRHLPRRRRAGAARRVRGPAGHRPGRRRDRPLHRAGQRRRSAGGQAGRGVRAVGRGGGPCAGPAEGPAQRAGGGNHRDRSAE